MTVTDLEFQCPTYHRLCRSRVGLQSSLERAQTPSFVQSRDYHHPVTVLWQSYLCSCSCSHTNTHPYITNTRLYLTVVVGPPSHIALVCDRLEALSVIEATLTQNAVARPAFTQPRLADQHYAQHVMWST
jgi:hypothetical protein